MDLQVDLFLYLKRNGLTIKKFSKLLGCTSQHIGKILNGKIMPSPLIAASIEKLTNGEIKAKDLRKNLEK